MNPMIYIYVQTYELSRPYFRRCLDSIKNQSYPYFKCLIYDNGSSASLREEIKNYVKDDTRFSVKYMEKAQVGEPIFLNCANEAILAVASKDDYVCRVDADDEIEKDYLLKSIELAIENEADFVATGSIFIDNETNKVLGVREVDNNYLLTGNGIAEVFPEIYPIMRTHWAKLFSIELFRKMNFSDIEAFPYGTDTMIVREALSRCNRLYVSKETLYKYYLYNDTKEYNIDSKRAEAPLKIYNRDIRFLLQNSGMISPRNFDFLIRTYMLEIIEVLNLIISNQIKSDNKLKLVLQIMSYEPTKILCRCGQAESFKFIAEWVMRQNTNIESLQMCAKILGIIKYIPDDDSSYNQIMLYKLLIMTYKYWDGSDYTSICSRLDTIKNMNPLLLDVDYSFMLTNMKLVETILENDYEESVREIYKIINKEYSTIDEIWHVLDIGLSIAAMLEDEEDFIKIKKRQLELLVDYLPEDKELQREIEEWCAMLPGDRQLEAIKTKLINYIG